MAERNQNHQETMGIIRRAPTCRLGSASPRPRVWRCKSSRRLSSWAFQTGAVPFQTGAVPFKPVPFKPGRCPFNPGRCPFKPGLSKRGGALSNRGGALSIRCTPTQAGLDDLVRAVLPPPRQGPSLVSGSIIIISLSPDVITCAKLTHGTRVSKV